MNKKLKKEYKKLLVFSFTSTQEILSLSTIKNSSQTVFSMLPQEIKKLKNLLLQDSRYIISIFICLNKRFFKFKQTEAGQTGVNKIETMLKDINNSEEFNIDNRKYISPMGIELNVNVLTTGSWPIANT